MGQGVKEISSTLVRFIQKVLKEGKEEEKKHLRRPRLIAQIYGVGKWTRPR